MAGTVESSTPASRYHRLRLSLFFIGFILELLFFFWAYASGFSWQLWLWADNLLIYLTSFFLINNLLFWPLDYLRSYRLERKFGMSTQSFASWMVDALKKLILSLSFMLATYLVFYALMEAFPRTWWLWAWGISSIFSIVMNIVFPVWLIPLFYKLQPLSNSSLAASIADTCRSCGVRPMKAFEIHLSKKTTRANAAVVGFGATRRVLLSDTLLSAFDPEEIQMVVAHEIGHHAKRHIGKTTLALSLLSLLGFYALSALITTEQLRQPALLPLLLWLAHVAGFLTTPAVCSLSRHHEKEADAYALKVYPNFQVFERLMHKLSTKNLSNPFPSALEEWFFYTHPSAKNRIAAARRSVAH